MQYYPNQEEFLEDFDFKSAELLGQGTFGKVFKAKAVKSLPQGHYALKIIETYHENAYELAIQELNLNHIVNYHSNVIRIYKVYSWIEQIPIKKYTLVLAMELGKNSLKQEIDNHRKTKQPFEDALMLDIMNQCLKAFHYLAKEKCLFHRDIKPENLLVTSHNPFTIKIADLGAGKENMNAQQMLNTLVGTPLFLSPKLFVAYSTNQTGKVNHNLEKTDVYSLGMTFLQLINILTDRELMKMNDPLIYDDKTGDPIDCSDDPEKLKECPGWIKLQNQVNNIQNQSIKACIFGMTHFSERQRFTWLQAIKSLNPDFQEDELTLPQNSIPRNNQQKALKVFTNGAITLKYIGSVQDSSPHRKMIPAGNCVIAYSNEGVRTITSTGVIQQIYSKNVQFLTYLPYLQVAVGINKNWEVFAINLKTKTNLEEKIYNFASDRVSVMKHMRKDLCILGNRQGEVFILAFDTQPPSVIKKYRDVDSCVIDLIYEDEFKQIISCHENKILYSKSLVYQQSTSYQTEQVLDNLVLINCEYFAALEQGTENIAVFHIYDFTITLVTKIPNSKNIIPQSLVFCEQYLVWVSDTHIFAIDIPQKIKDNINNQLLISQLKPSGHLCYLKNDQTLVASDGTVCSLYTIGKSQVSKNICCKNCQIQ